MLLSVDLVNLRCNSKIKFSVQLMMERTSWTLIEAVLAPRPPVKRNTVLLRLFFFQLVACFLSSIKTPRCSLVYLCSGLWKAATALFGKLLRRGVKYREPVSNAKLSKNAFFPLSSSWRKGMLFHSGCYFRIISQAVSEKIYSLPHMLRWCWLAGGPIH